MADQTANEELYDATVRHQVLLLRYAKGQAKAVLKILKQADAELVAQLQAELTELTAGRLKALLTDIRKQRTAVMESVRQEIAKDAEELAASEAKWELKAIQEACPVVLALNVVSPAVIKAVASSPINGVPLEGWIGNLRAGDIHRLEQQMRLSLVQGETVDQMVARIRGTKATNFEDGVLATTRRNAEAIARTAASHVSSVARQEVWDANSDIISGVRWVATLDGRTSSVCRGRDGHVFPIDSGPRPPAHVNCRSSTVPVLDGEAIVGERPSIRDSRTRKAREADFRAEAKAEAGADWKKMSKEQRDDAVRGKRQAWADQHIGREASNVTYDEWLRRQPKAFQDEVLGPGRGDLFRGGMTLDKFIDERGKTYTLEQLKAES